MNRQEDSPMDAQSRRVALSSLKDAQYTAIINSQDYKRLLSNMSIRIREKARRAPNEATIESYFDSELFAFFRDVFAPLGFEYAPQKEAAVETCRCVAKGRADSAIGAFIVEFKQPSALSSPTQQEKAIRQISEYMLAMPEESGSVGFLTDGTKGCFIERQGERTFAEPFEEIHGAQLERFIQYVVHLSLKELTSQNLVDSFCGDTGIGYELTRALFTCLQKELLPKTQMLLNEWKELFRLAHDDVSKQQAIIDRRKALETVLGTHFAENNEEYTALFALQTAYAIIVKIAAYRIVSIARYNASLIEFEKLVGIDQESLREHMSSLEEGELFRSYGITNLLEGDFFSWYTTKGQWNATIADKISTVFATLSKYADKPVLNSLRSSSDFFKELYQTMIPSAVRHSLGEYYTKRWLAESVVAGALELADKKGWKGLDPCCGSGTFLTVMIDKVLDETKDAPPQKQLQEVLSRVKGIDLNPIASLTARINYFINIAHLITNDEELEIPVYLGDASYMPQKRDFGGIDCFEYTISTLRQPIRILIPASMIADPLRFSRKMTEIEFLIKAQNEDAVYTQLASLVAPEDLTEPIKISLRQFVTDLVDLERLNWNGIWARIISNFITTANLGKFDIIVGNPPWVDWRSLPSGYRDKIKSLCISRKLFSGDSITGGINLNICALISNVAAENWLARDGVLGFLMPEPLIFQQTYEGFRKFYLADGSRLYFQKLTNWNQAGSPFKPVTQKFLTYYLSRTVRDYRQGIEVDTIILDKNKGADDKEFLDKESFQLKKSLAANCHANKNMFSYVDSRELLQNFQSIAGNSYYTGRQGIEFYPQELLIFTANKTLPSTKTCLSLKNIQVNKSKYHVPPHYELLEKDFLNPLVKGIHIKPFHVDISDEIVPFPYDKKDMRLPMPFSELSIYAPQLAKFYQKHKTLISSQTTYNQRIIGKQGEFYALARVGTYSFADIFVVFRDNTQWASAVVTAIDTTWGGKRRPLFQKHAVAISQRDDGTYITLDEAHFICGILNTRIVGEYMKKSSDSRSYPIRPRVWLPLYDANNPLHLKISQLSQQAHKDYQDENKLAAIVRELDALYLELAKKR